MAYSTISKPSLHFNTKLYTGNGSTQSITGVGFQPDWVWLKKRNSTADHGLYDAVRGVTKQLYSNDTAAEATNANSLTAFGTDGFSIGTSSMINGNSDTFASWNWKANGAGSANTDGTINSTVSANTTAGFSIVKYTGTGSVATVGHGLGAAPKMMLIRILEDPNDWQVYHQSIGNTHKLNLNTTEGSSDQINRWNDTSPTSSVFTLGTHSSVNASGPTYIAYCFAEKKGYSKFGSYTGNDNADGTFVYTGFKPAWIIRKNIDGGVTESWFMEDNKRNTFNPANEWLAADQNSAEGANNFDTDFLSNGFKMRSNNHGTNKGSTNYIYMAFAEEPLVANVGASIPATAR